MALDAQALAQLAALTDGQLAPDPAQVALGGEDGPQGAVAAGSPARPQDRSWEVLVEAAAVECGVAADALAPDTRLVEDLDCDDLQRYVLVTAVEHECSLRLPDAAVDAAQTLGDLHDAAKAALDLG